ncbi:porin family protein [Neisseria sp. CCUG17229]|uniref:porin family protein n=1 Tax=Neisseria sp. CCUG17229 TaxID=3392036 RepID=UPI003A102B92
MKNTKLLAALAAIGVSFVSLEAQAGMVTDAHGNQGYDTAAECDAAVLNGTAKFYESFTHKPALKRAGEASVQTATLKDLGPQYRLGACDLGVGHKLGRDGVSKALQGKYVPYSPDMAVNVYLDAAGKPVRASMKQCDNWFSGNAPRPVAIPAPKPAPVAAAPVVAAPVVAATQSSGVRPYVFGSVGALRDGISTSEADHNFNDRDTVAAGQIGVGAQFNDLLGAEVYYQGGDKLKYQSVDGEDSVEVRNHTAAARLTAGANVTDKARLFAKAGVAAVQQRGDGDKETKARATAGVGATYDLTDNWAVRADYDHYFKRNGDDGVKWKGADYLGIGAQYKF